MAVLLYFSMCGWPISHRTWPSETAHLIHINIYIIVLCCFHSLCMSIAVGFIIPVFLCFFARTGSLCLFCGTPSVTLKNPKLLFVSGSTILGPHLPHRNSNYTSSAEYSLWMLWQNVNICSYCLQMMSFRFRGISKTFITAFAGKAFKCPWPLLVPYIEISFYCIPRMGLSPNVTYKSQ